MATVTLRIALAPDTDAAAAADAVQTVLQQQPGIAAAEAHPSELRVGVAEATLAIGAAVVLLKSGREAIDELRALVRSLNELIKEVKGVRDVFVEVSGARKRLEEIDDEDITALSGAEATT